jgi:hypothetical protein
MRSAALYFPRRVALVAAMVAMSLFACGGGGGGSSSGGGLSVNFTESATALAVHLVKLQQKSKSGKRVVVQVVIGGPDNGLDMYSFAFDVKIADTTVLGFVPGSAAAGSALTAFAGQTINVQATTAPGDASDVVVGVSKFGIGLGNGVAGASTVVVALSFDVKKSGTTSLTIGNGVDTPMVLDHLGNPIASITFDAASATVQGVSN